VIEPQDHILTASPYPGLRPFRRDEADIFFGREEQVDQLLARLEKGRFLAVVGVSGCGKSSLVRAGMLSALERGFLASAGPCWQVAEMRPGNHPLLNLAQALLLSGRLGSEWMTRDDARSFLVAALRRGPLGLVELLCESPQPQQSNLLILVDQFEEIFRFHRHGDANEATAFVDLLLASAAHETLPIYVAITMRSDFLGDCSIFTGLPEAINVGEFLIPRLTREQCRAAIVGPAAAFGASVDSILVTRILNDTGTDPDQLPLIQHALMRVWTRATAEGTSTADQPAQKQGDRPVKLSIADYESVGGLKEALSIHADELYAGLSTQEQRIAEVLMRSLSERGGDQRDTRRPVPLKTVAAVAQEIPEAVAQVVEVFRQPDCSFLTPPIGVPIEPDTILDIGHESLIRQWKRMSKWVQVEADAAAIYRRLTETAQLWKQDRAALWSTPDLENALSWREREKPNRAWAERYGGHFEASMEFLDASVAARDRHLRDEELRRQRELKLLQDKADAERLRADEADERRREQWAANRRLKSRAVVAAAAGLASIVLAVIASFLYLHARSERDRADGARREAVDARTQAESSAWESKQAAVREAVARQAAEEAARQSEESQDEAVAQTISAYASLARAHLARSQSLWSAAEPGRQQKALELLQDTSRLRDESAKLLPLLKHDAAGWRERAGREWSELLPQIRSQAVRWLSYSSLQPIQQYTAPALNSPPPVLSPDGNLFAHFENDPQTFARGAYRLIETRSGKVIAQLTVDGSSARAPSALQFSADGQLLFAACVVQGSAGRSSVAIERRSASDLSLIKSVTFSDVVEEDQPFAFVGQREWHFDRAARTLVQSRTGRHSGAWGTDTGRRLCDVTGLQFFALNGAGDQMIGTPGGSSVRFVGVEDGKTVRDLEVATGGKEIRGAWCSPDDRWLVVELTGEYRSAGYATPVHIVDLFTGQTATRLNLTVGGFPFFFSNEASTLRIDFDSGCRLMAAMAGKSIFLISLPEGGILHQMQIADPPGHNTQYPSPDNVQFSREGNLLMTAIRPQFGGNQDALVHFWDVSVAPAGSRSHVFETPVKDLAFADSGHLALAGGDEFAGVQVRNLQGVVHWSTKMGTAASGYDPSGRHFVHVLPDRVEIRDSACGRLVQTIERRPPGNISVWPTSEKFRWIVGLDRRTDPPQAGLFDATALEWKFQIPSPADRDAVVKFSADERFVAVHEANRRVAGGPSPLTLFRLPDGKRLLRLESGADQMRFAGPDHLLVADSQSNTRVLAAYHVESGCEIGKLPFPASGVSINLDYQLWVSTDGRTAAYTTNNANGKLRIWQFAEQKLPLELNFEFEQIHGVQLTKDRLLTSAQSRVPSAGAPEEKPTYAVQLFNFKSPQPLKGRVTAALPNVYVSPDYGTALLSDAGAAEVRRCELWDLESGRELQTFAESAVGLSPDGRFAVLQSGRIVDLKQLPSPPATAPASEKTVSAYFFSPNSRVVVLQTAPGGSVVKGLTAPEFEIFLGTEQNPSFSPDSRLLFTHDQTAGRVRVRDLTDGSLQREIDIRHRNYLPVAIAPAFVENIQFSLDGKHLAVKAHGQLRLANVDDGRIHTSLARSSHDQRVLAISASHGGRIVASGGDDRTICFWNSADGRYLGMLEGFGSPLVAVDFGPGAFASGNPLFAARNETGGISVWELSLDGDGDEQTVAATYLWGNVEAAGRLVRWSLDGARLAAGDATGAIRLFDGRTGELAAMLLPESGPAAIQAIAFEPHSARLALAGIAGTIALWSAGSPAVEMQWESGQSTLFDLAFSPDGRLLASAGSAVRLWNPRDGELLLAIDRHTQAVRDVAFDPDGNWLASVSDDRSEFDISIADLSRELDRMRFGWSGEHPLEQFAAGRGSTAVAVKALWRPATSNELEVERVRVSHGWSATTAENARDWKNAVQHLSRLCEIDPNNVNYQWRRARAFAESGRWKESAAEWEKTIQLKPDDANSHYYRAIAALADDRVDDYRRDCREMLERFGKTKDADVAARILYTVVPVPDALDDPSILVELGDLAGHPRLKGAALYRHGEYEPAIKQLVQQSTYGARPWDMLFLSMAYARTGKKDDARKLLNDAVPAVAAMEKNFGWTGWFERVETDLLRREAESLLVK
jgi:WD40 repeat protein